MRILTVNLFLLLCVFVKAQHYTHSLSVVSKQNGLQALPIDPQLKNIASNSFNDVRLYDKNNTEVPYFLVNESFNYSSTNFKEYKVIDEEVGNGRYTRFTVTNPDKQKIHNIVLCVANSDAWKVCDITGSDDNKQWFSVSDHIFMYNLFSEGSVDAYRSIHFPLINYKYIKIEINDLGTKPLNIKKAGYFDGAISAGKLNEVEPIEQSYNTDKTKKISTSLVKFSDPTPINKINFKIKSPNYYKRSAEIYVMRSRTIKQKQELYRVVLSNFELNSEANNSFTLDNFREKEFYIEIKNEDNPPLEFETVEFKQLQTYMVADFKANENYILMAGNKKLSVPKYDIEFFKNKISQYLPTLEVGELNKIPVKAADAIVTAEKSVFQQPWFMWTCIAVASFVLFLFSVRVLKEMKKGDS